MSWRQATSAPAGAVTPVELFYRIAYTLVFCVSVMLLWQGVSGLMRG